MLRDIGYLSKIENPDSMRRIINRLPFALRRSWRDVADAIMERESREVTIDDIAKFVESKARASSHPIFGNIPDEVKDNRKEETRRRREDNSRKNFAINRDERPNYSPTKSPVKCPGCDVTIALHEDIEQETALRKAFVKFKIAKRSTQHSFTKTPLIRTV